MKMKEKFQRFWTMSKDRKGFTLVELIVVIAILAILAGVAIPVYNGYIKKAQEAADNQLMDSINTAFAATCLVNGLDHTATVGELTINADGTIIQNGPITLAAGYSTATHHYFKAVAPLGDVSLAEFDATFFAFFAGNEEAKFSEKFIEEHNGKLIVTGAAEGDGGNVEIKYGNTTLSVPQAYIDALNKSGFITYDGLGTATLVNKLDRVTTLAESLVASGNNGNAATLMNSVFGSDEFISFMGEALDADLSTTEKQEAVLQEFLANNEGLTQEKLFANAAVIYASKNAASMNQDDIITMLTSGNGKQTILNSMSSGNTTEAFAQAALAYGMYTSFAHSEYGSAEAQGKDEFGAINDLNNEKFKEYMNSDAGKADLEGYIAALNMINSSADNSDAMNKLLVNGFGDADLIAAINGALGK